jgi:hypothetical protein
VFVPPPAAMTRKVFVALTGGPNGASAVAVMV